MTTDTRRPERPWATGVLVVSGLISLSFNVRHSFTATSLPAPLALLYGAGPVALAATMSHVVALQASRGELVGWKRKTATFGLVIGALALSFLGMYDLLQHTVPNPFRHNGHGLSVNLPAVLTPIVIDLMAIAALNELLRTPNSVRVAGATNGANGATSAGGHDRGATTSEGHKPAGGHNLQGATTGANVPGPRLPLESGATNGANEPVAPRETPVAPKAVAPKPAAKVAPANDGGRLIEFAPRGETQAAMRAHWDKQIADGFIPSGADLNRAVDKAPKYSLGKKYAGQWRQELPEEFVEAVEAGRHEDAREIAAGFSAGERKEVAQ
jgi:hypothetical protein